MKTLNTLRTLALIGAASASFAASAAIVNPDNDSAAFFTYTPASAAVSKAPATLLRAGDVSSNGLYAYSASDRGWMARTHSFEIVAGGLAHTSDCLTYNAPTPIAALVPMDQRGAFGDHGV